MRFPVQYLQSRASTCSTTSLLSEDLQRDLQFCFAGRFSSLLLHRTMGTMRTAAMMCSVAALFAGALAEDWNLVLAHSNDILSQLDQITDDYNQCHDQDQKCFGGVARHRSRASQLRSEASAKGDVFLHLNAGSMLGGSVWFPILGVEPMVNATSYLAYNALGLGYRDFDEGLTTARSYLSRLQSLDVKVVCANANFTGEPSFNTLVRRSVVLEPKPGVKIGIIGFLGTDADHLADTGKIQFIDEVEAIKAEMEQLKRNEGVNFFIALGSAGYVRGKEILDKLPELDILVNGGSNTFLHTGPPPPSTDKVVGPYPYEPTSGGNKRALVQVPRHGKYLGILKVKVSGDGKVKEFKSDSNPERLEGDQDQQLKDYVSKWASQVAEQSKQVIGKSLVPLVSSRETCWVEECNAGALIADAALWFLNKNQTTNQWSQAVAAVVWHGGALVRTNLTIAAGDVTFGHILAMFPFANTLAYVTLKGDLVRKLFETSVEFINNPNMKASGEFLHVAGARVEYDLSQSPGSRVTKILIRNPTSTSADLVALNETNYYRVGMPSFISRGGVRYQFLENLIATDTGVRDEDVLREYISFMQVITTGTEDRVAFVTVETCWVDQTGTVFLTIFLTLLFTGLIYLLLAYGYPKLRERGRGSLTNLVR